MTYVEFPFDQIIELHFKKKDEPPEPDPGVGCGTYERELGAGVTFGTGVDASWLAIVPPMEASSVHASIPNAHYDPDTGLYTTEFLVAENIISVKFEYSVSIDEFSANDNPAGLKLRQWSGTAVGFGSVDPAAIVYDPTRPNYVPPPGSPNLGSSSISVPGGGAVSASVDVKATYVNGQLRRKGYYVFVMSQGVLTQHNPSTESSPTFPGPDGWNDNQFRASGHFRVTLTCATIPPTPPSNGAVSRRLRRNPSRW